MAIKKIKAKSPDPYLGKTTGDATLARIAHVNQLVDQINANDPSPYKVYTALLTQNGGSEEIQLYSGSLIIGVTYFITDSGGDFTNVGAPNNDLDTYFVATGTTPNNWGSGGLRYNTGAPVVTVLENTIGNITWHYFETGKSGGTFSTVPDWNKLAIFIGSSGTVNNIYVVVNTDYNILIGDWTNNNILYNTPIEIRVYN